MGMNIAKKRNVPNGLAIQLSAIVSPPWREMLTQNHKRKNIKGRMIVCTNFVIDYFINLK